MTTGELLLVAWAPGYVVPGVCLVALTGYVARYREALSTRFLTYVLAVALFFLALASPIGVLAHGYLFSAHMLQHLLLTLIVPALVLVGLPRSRPEAHEKRKPMGAASSWALGVGAMWLWHARPLCNAAAASTVVLAIQTASLVGMGLAFWRPILDPRATERMQSLAGVAYLFSACVACTILGVMVTLSPVEVCTAYMHPVDTLGALPLLREGWGLTCKADQELGGLLMWVPTCFVYAAAILVTLARYYADERPGAVTARALP